MSRVEQFEDIHQSTVNSRQPTDDRRRRIGFRNPQPAIDLLQDRIRDLRENTDFVSALLETLVGYAIIAADFDGNIIAFNEGSRQIYGYAPEEVIGNQSIDIFFPDDFVGTGRLQQVIDELIAKGRFSYEGEKVRKNGGRFPAQVLFTLTKDKNGKVVGFIEIVEDLTERKCAEQAQAQAQAQAARVEQLERELRSLGQVSVSADTTVTARMFGLKPLYESAPDTFRELVEGYGNLMDLALEQRAYRVDHSVSGRLRSISDELGFMKAGPRDVVEIHSKALKTKTNSGTPEKTQAYAEEGRLMVLELMGYLVSYYRKYGPGAGGDGVSATPRAKLNSEASKGGSHE